MESKHIGALVKEGCETTAWCGMTINCIRQGIFGRGEKQCLKTQLE